MEAESIPVGEAGVVVQVEGAVWGKALGAEAEGIRECVSEWLEVRARRFAAVFGRP